MKSKATSIFNDIAKNYDLLNRVLSLGIDRSWRKEVVNSLEKYKPKYILDVSTGTGDLALEILKIKPKQIIGLDPSSGMLEIAKKKTKKIKFKKGIAEKIPFNKNKFDVVTVGFGVRNFENLEKGLKEIRRVLNRNGVLIILEFSKPNNFLIRQLFNFYLNILVPFIGSIFSKKSAYSYLSRTVNEFPYGIKLAKIIKKSGFKNVKIKSLTFGVCSIYICEK